MDPRKSAFSDTTLGFETLRQKYLDARTPGTFIPLTDEEASHIPEEIAISQEDAQAELDFLQGIE